MRTVSASSISVSNWAALNCGDTIIDHDNKPWNVVWVDGSTSSKKKLHVAPSGAFSGPEVRIILTETGKISVLYGEKAEALTRPTKKGTELYQAA
ncbi:MAG: hypothetical protein HY979_01245 [Candidatus Magasanikbacteria bacterium]|nr:hypothetical protein [Candidatus Magasanikbacteria bacterium]